MGVKEAFISTRPWSFPMTIIIVSFGSFYVILDKGLFDPLLYVLTLFGVLFLHASANLLNDYFDYKKKLDTVESPTAKYRPHPILTGFYSSSLVLGMSVIYAVLGLSLGLYLTYVTNIITLYLGILGVLLVYMYNGPPFGLKYKALGELEVFIVWGVLMPLGAYYVQTEYLSINIILASLPLGFFVSAVLLANNLRDIDFDRKSGVKTLSIILGVNQGLKIYESLLYAPYIIQFILILLRVIPIITIFTFLTFYDVYKTIHIFKNKIPEAADPMTANVLLRYGIIYLLTLIFSILFKLP